MIRSSNRLFESRIVFLLVWTHTHCTSSQPLTLTTSTVGYVCIPTYTWTSYSSGYVYTPTRTWTYVCNEEDFSTSRRDTGGVIRCCTVLSCFVAYIMPGKKNLHGGKTSRFDRGGTSAIDAHVTYVPPSSFSIQADVRWRRSAVAM